jgi:hypothetical protein
MGIVMVVIVVMVKLQFAQENRSPQGKVQKILCDLLFYPDHPDRYDDDRERNV